MPDPSAFHLEPGGEPFEGFSSQAFEVLDRLRARPFIDQYREEQAAIARHLTGPFKRYRDALLMRWVIPDRLELETRRNVFSRLLKNDFGAGGCHHHLWMAFYHPERRRLTDVQLIHSISPDDFQVGLYVGDHALETLRAAQDRIRESPERFLEIVNPLLETGFRLQAYGIDKGIDGPVYADRLETVPLELSRARGIYLWRSFDRETVIGMGEALVDRTVGAARALWPLYRLWKGERGA